MGTLVISENLELVPVDESITETLFSLVDRNRLYLKQWLPWLDITTTDTDVKNFLANAARDMSEKRAYTFGIYLDKTLVGIVGTHAIQWDHKRASFGYWLSEAHNGMGVMTQACNRLVEFCFVELGLHRLEIYCAADNKKSRAIPMRLGFTKEGRLRKSEWLYDHFVDQVVFSLLSTDSRPTLS